MRSPDSVSSFSVARCSLARVIVEVGALRMLVYATSSTPASTAGGHDVGVLLHPPPHLRPGHEQHPRRPLEGTAERLLVLVVDVADLHAQVGGLLDLPPEPPDPVGRDAPAEQALDGEPPEGSGGAGDDVGHLWFLSLCRERGNRPGQNILPK